MSTADRIYVGKSQLIYDPPARHKFSVDGYGRKINTGCKIMHEGRKYTVYAACISNVQTLYIMAGGRKIIIDVDE